MIDKNKCDYVALLFYATWCPFSKSLRPNFDLISLLYSSVPHFAIEESSVKARLVFVFTRIVVLTTSSLFDALCFVCVWFSTLSKYGVHGFPSIILLNTTMRVAYRGSRTIDSLVAFYSDVTGKTFVITAFYLALSLYWY